MSPRAAWRREGLRFGEVYDYVGSKMEWIGAGLPWEGSEASQPKLGDLATADVALCALDDSAGVVRSALGQGPVCLVVNEERIVLGLVRAEALGPDDDRPVSEIMDEGPSTYRPHVAAAEMAERPSWSSATTGPGSTPLPTARSPCPDLGRRCKASVLVTASNSRS